MSPSLTKVVVMTCRAALPEGQEDRFGRTAGPVQGAQEGGPEPAGNHPDHHQIIRAFQDLGCHLVLVKRPGFPIPDSCESLAA